MARRRKKALTWRKVRKITVRVASCNVPESGKRGLIRNRVIRARRYLSMMTRPLIGIAGLNETSHNLKNEVRKHPRWRSTVGRPNSRAWGTWQATATLINRIWFKQVGPMRNIVVDGLHQPVTLVQHRRSGWSFVVIVFHAPTKRADPDESTRRKIVEKISDYLEDQIPNVPALVIGDANDGNEGKEYRGLLTVLHKHYVDYIMATEHWTGSHRRVINMPGVSDHKFPTVQARPHWVGDQINRLPIPK